MKPVSQFHIQIQLFLSHTKLRIRPLLQKPYYFAHMAKKWIPILLFVSWTFSAKSQFLESNVLNGEVGIAIGAAHYFGDLNTRAAINRPKIAASLMFRKQFGSY